MAPDAAQAHSRRWLSTQRVDAWWLQPVALWATLVAFVIYATWRVFENGHFYADNGAYHYVSPLGSPDLTGIFPASWKAAVPLLAYPAILILPIPAGFRFTCYWFRRSYYRAFVARPAACAVEATKGVRYKGERGLMAVNNLHRFFLYLAIAKMLFDAWHVVTAVATPHGLYLGLGVLILLIDIVLLGAYVLGCHALRHLVGGRLDCFSCDALTMRQHGFWKAVTVLNRKHGFWAMASLFWIALTDLYIRHLSQTGLTHVLGVPA
ncbi:MAG TPA: succinate dehydrogenase [Candidatus Thermoplasmatota archaeon]|nr:succinate dehydrogenase [Candidatus Thermoplasmatota archaeon]